MLTQIVKRDGRVMPYDRSKITEAVKKAFDATNEHLKSSIDDISEEVEKELEKKKKENPSVEDIQDKVEKTLIDGDYPLTAKAYILYRAERSRQRELKSRLMQTYDDITFKMAKDSDIKRENANVDGNTAMGTMLKYGSEGAKHFYQMNVLKPEHSQAHIDGDIHIHDLDFLTLTTTCCQIDLIKLFDGGFNTGHGTLREPNDIQSYSALACIAVQSNQNDQHGGQSIVNFDYGLAPGIIKTFKKRYKNSIITSVGLLADEDMAQKAATAYDELIAEDKYPRITMTKQFEPYIHEKLIAIGLQENIVDKVLSFCDKKSTQETERAAFQAMEALVHNLNTMHSRAGAQTPFSSINYGMDTSPEGRLVTKSVLLAQEKGLGKGETPIFPIHIFRVKKGTNFEEGEPSYDLFKLAMRVSAKRLFPNFSFQDAPFNMQYYKEGQPETEVAYMGCRTRVISNIYDKSQEVSYGRGNLSFTSINLPRLGIEAKGNINWFFKLLDEKIDLVFNQLLERFEIQARKKVLNYPFLMGAGVWLDSEKLNPEDEVREVLKHGTLSIGFIGLAETLVALTGKHHGESPISQNLGLKIVSHLRDRTDKKSEETGLNFSLIATPAEGLSGRFVKMDSKIYGKLAGITDREYYTNSFHVPVYYNTTAFKKIDIEVPYHELTNAGHITYVELDGDPSKNLEAFESIIKHMCEVGIGYGSINHPVDRDPVCGYTGIIDNFCPECGRTETEHRNFERIRRITGYLVGTVDRFNNAKRAEEKDRVKHGVSKEEVGKEVGESKKEEFDTKAVANAR